MISAGIAAHFELSHTRFKTRCKILFSRHPSPEGRCAHSALEVFEQEDGDRRGGRLEMPAWVALCELGRWDQFWLDLHEEDSSLSRWALDCLRLSALEAKTPDRVAAHCAAALFAHAGCPSSTLSDPLARACAASLWRMLSWGLDNPPTPSFVERKLGLACLSRLDGTRAKPGSKAWRAILSQSLDARLALLDDELAAKLCELELSACLREPADAPSGRRRL